MTRLPRTDREKLWAEYWSDRSSLAARDRLVDHYLPLLKLHVRRMTAKLQGHVEPGELLGTAFCGLIDAIKSFDPGRGVTFETFCYRRIVGAMLDGLRETDWATRTMRRRAKRFESATDSLGQRLGRTPTEAEIAAELEIGEAELQYYARAAWQTAATSLQTPVGGGDGDEAGTLGDFLPGKNHDPEAAARRHAWGRQAIGLLKERDQTIVRLYYWSWLTMKEIGRKLGITESAVSLQLDRILFHLCSRLAGTETELD